MKILTAKQMARWDKLTIGQNPQVAKRLMHQAAQACVEIILKKNVGIAKSSRNVERVVIMCGPGNNGGDGLAMAGILSKLGIKVQTFFLGKFGKLSPEAQFFYQQLPLPLQTLEAATSLNDLKIHLKSADWVVDAIFGIGLNRKIMGRLAEIISLMNRAPGRKLAVDMPSGISSDTGEILGICFQADITVSFEAPKWGQVVESAWDAVGELIVKPIGLKQKILKNFISAVNWLEEITVAPWFQKRPKAWHKGKAGRVLIVAGSREMPGAGYLSSLGALRSGAGVVHWALPESALQKLQLQVPEVILDFIPSSKNVGHFSKTSISALEKKMAYFQALALGPGWGNTEDTQQFLSVLLKKTLKKNRIPYVLDADALNALAAQKDLYPFVKGAILTPHPKEMARLLGKDLPLSLKERIKTVRQFAKHHGVYLILKSYRSILATPQGEVWLNSAGGPNLAVAGSGDMLTGIIAGLLAQGFKPKQAMLAGAFLHGRAGDLLAEVKGDRGTLASEVAAKVPEVIRTLLS